MRSKIIITSSPISVEVGVSDRVLIVPVMIDSIYWASRIEEENCSPSSAGKGGNKLSDMLGMDEVRDVGNRESGGKEI